MTTLVINDLTMSKELDRKALSNVIGRGRVAWEYLGSSVGPMSAWRYTGRNFKRFLQNSYLSGHGWVQKYRTGYQYKRQQFKWNFFNEFYK